MTPIEPLRRTVDLTNSSFDRQKLYLAEQTAKRETQVRSAKRQSKKIPLRPRVSRFVLNLQQNASFQASLLQM